PDLGFNGELLRIRGWNHPRAIHEPAFLKKTRGRGRSILPSARSRTVPAKERDEPNPLVDDRAPGQADDRRGCRARDPTERARPGNGVDQLLVQRPGRGETDLGGVLDEDLAPDPQHR